MANIISSFTRVIQSSHPVCNTIMLFGVITCLISVILLGIDGRFVGSDTYPQVMVVSFILFLVFFHSFSALLSFCCRFGPIPTVRTFKIHEFNHSN